MVLALIGESCTGKSTLAEKLKAAREAEIYSGKDYLRLAKSEAEAAKVFAALLREHETDGTLLIYVISEKEQLSLLPQKAVRVLLTAELPIIQERFAERTGGVLPLPWPLCWNASTACSTAKPALCALMRRMTERTPCKSYWHS